MVWNPPDPASIANQKIDAYDSMREQNMGTCPKCNSEDFFQMNRLFVVSPAGWNRFDKTAMRSKELRISATERVLLWCEKCGYTINLKGDMCDDEGVECNQG